MYQVTSNELSSLQDSGLSAAVDIALFTLCAGIFVTLIVTLSTVNIDGAKIFASYIGGAIVTGIGMICFGIRSFAAWRNAKAKLRDIQDSNP